MLENRYIAWLIYASMANIVASGLLRQLHIQDEGFWSAHFDQR
jgi:hypothetical protein